MESPSAPLAVPAVSSLRVQQATPMERTLSQDIRNEREELREAAEQTLNAIVDLNLDGTIKWVSPSWTDVVGTPFDAINGKPMSDLIVSENKNVFTDMVVSMKKDDSKSYRIRFAIQLGPLSKLRYVEEPAAEAEENEQPAGEPEPQTADLEAQGITVYDSASGGESHVSLLGYSLCDQTLNTSLIKHNSLPDHVDASPMDGSTGNPDRPARCHCRFPWLWCRIARQLSHKAR